MRSLIVILLLIFPLSSFGLDKELNESLKCISIYRHYERTLKLPENTLYAMGIHETGKTHSESRKNIAWPWSVNKAGKSYYFDNKREAVAFVKKEIKVGNNNIDVGCMQVNLKHHPDAFPSIEKAFSPRYNVRYAANFLIQKYKAKKSWGDAIAHYHSANPAKGKKYKNKVIKIAKNIDSYKSLYLKPKHINSKSKKLVAKTRISLKDQSAIKAI